MKKEVLIVGIVLVGIIAVSGCTALQATGKTYNGSYMSFQYPDGFNIAETNAGRTVVVAGNGNILINQYGSEENQMIFISGLKVESNVTKHDSPFNYTTGMSDMEDEVMYFTRDGKYYVITYPTALREKVVELAKTIKNNQ